MIALRRSVPLVAALVLLGLAAACAFFAVDVRAWQHTVTRDDVRFHALPTRRDLWRSPAILPGDPARAVLGLGDGLAYRQSLRLFWLTEVGVAHAGTRNLSQTEIRAQEDLQALADHARSAPERSAAANLLGVMTIRTPPADRETQIEVIKRAEAYFRQAIGEDSTNWPAKVNLELVLRLTKPDKSRFGIDAHGGFGSGGSQGAGIIGGGF